LGVENKMRILVLAPYFLPVKGGLISFVWQTARRLAEKGHSVAILTSRLKGMKENEIIDGIQVIRCPSWDVLPSRVSIPLSIPFNSIPKPDVVITNTRFYFWSFRGGRFARKHGIPWLHVEHGSSQVKYENPFVRFFAWLTDAFIGKWVLRNARIVGVSQASCNFAQELGAKECEVLYNSVDTKFFNGKKKKHKGVSIVFANRLVVEKGVQDLLAAVHDLDVKVTIVGSGPYEKELRAMAGSNAEFIGEKDAAGVRDAMASADILVNPSYAEGLPTMVLEGGAMGLAVVATDVGGTKEVIKDGVTGFLVKPKDVAALRDKIDNLIKNSALRKRLGTALQKKIRKEFDWDITVKKLNALLSE